jgi:hypothetical protein
MTAIDNSSGPSAPRHPEPIPIARGTIQVSAADDGAFVLFKLALYLEPDDALDLCLRTIGAVARAKKRAAP